MLSRPFRALPRGRLITLLILLLLLEVAGGFGLYVNNRPASAAPAPTPTRTVAPPARGPATLAVQNTPRTVILGSYETFSVKLKNLKNVLLVYTLEYPDGTSDAVKVLTDATGFSKQRFRIQYKLHSHREPVVINVSYKNVVRATTDFAVQMPSQ